MKHIFLYGPPGSGKSTVGKALADSLELPFVDLDRVIENAAGETIAQIVETKGEAWFRDRESAFLQNIIGDAESVIALGGGTLLRAENRAFVEGHGKVLVLTAEMPTLLKRLQNENVLRPLLAGDLNSKLTALIKERREHYASFPLRIALDEKTIAQSAQDLRMILGRHHLSAMGKYDAVIDDVSRLADYSMRNPFIVTDENVGRYHLGEIKSILTASGLEPKSIVLQAGEEHKNLETVSRLWDAFLGNSLDRQSTVIALGGGVIGDLAGFAAATYMRGIDWICVPTTLLGMADSSLGGKTGFDLPEGKNLIGSFHSPKLVLGDVKFLTTLPEAELISGMAEVVKHGIISDPELFSMCTRGLTWAKNNLEEMVKRAMAVKINIIEGDPYEKGIRAALNLGHTIGHAVELASGFQLRHGEAVAIGLVAEAKFAERLAIAATGLANAIAETLSALGLPVHIPKDMPRGRIVEAMRMDKKRNAKAIRFALPAEIGKVELVDVTDLESTLEEI